MTRPQSATSSPERRAVLSAPALAAALLTLARRAIERGSAVPAALQDRAGIPGIPNAALGRCAGGRAARRGIRRPGRRGTTCGAPAWIRPAPNAAGVSAGAVRGSDHGSFGAGVLVGWTEAGTRSEFKLVTGISTGALIAPLAFLGSGKDHVLLEVYTELGPNQIFRRRDWLSILASDSLSDTRPLLATICRHMDEATLTAIVEEYRKGRLLLIVKTNLDSMRPSIWDIGVIEASSSHDALGLVCRIMLASASVPTVFPPVMFEVEANGHRFQEMDVDGGAIAQTFLSPSALTRDPRDRAALLGRERHAWVIRNVRLGSEWHETERAVLSIAGRAISSMIAYSGRNDLQRLQAQAERHGIAFNLAYIRDDFTLPWERPFDRAWMRALYEYGRRRALDGRAWERSHPALAGRRPTGGRR